MNVILSIKPVFAEKIFSGEKKYEFRKTLFKDGSVKKIIVYASSPKQMVIGEFDIEDVLTMNPVDLWEATQKYSGISKDYFTEYFQDKKIGHAIKIKEARKYDSELNLFEEFGIHPPQSFAYIRN